jgi:hypothetical protein
LWIVRGQPVQDACDATPRFRTPTGLPCSCTVLVRRQSLIFGAQACLVLTRRSCAVTPEFCGHRQWKHCLPCYCLVLVRRQSLNLGGHFQFQRGLTCPYISSAGAPSVLGFGASLKCTAGYFCGQLTGWRLAGTWHASHRGAPLTFLSAPAHCRGQRSDL